MIKKQLLKMRAINAIKRIFKKANDEDELKDLVLWLEQAELEDDIWTTIDF